MSKLFDKTKTDRSQQTLQLAENQDAKLFIQSQMASGQQQLDQGFRGAYNVLQGAMPQQLQAVQQGNMAAQSYLLGGMPAFQASVMGGLPNFQMPRNFGGYQSPYAPQQFQMPMNTQFANQPFPQMNPQMNPLAGSYNG